MNWAEAFAKMIEGKEVRRTAWTNVTWRFFLEDGRVKGYGDSQHTTIQNSKYLNLSEKDKHDILANDWVVHTDNLVRFELIGEHCPFFLYPSGGAKYMKIKPVFGYNAAYYDKLYKFDNSQMVYKLGEAS